MKTPNASPPIDRATLEHALARQLARASRDWAERAGLDEAATALLAGVVERLAEAMAAGHICLPVESPAIRADLAATGLVATVPAPAPLPFVLDADGRFYLHRYYDYEARLATGLLRLADIPAPMALPAVVADLLPRLFDRPGGCGNASDWQKIAVLRALTSRLTIICGGPGTGKTTTVAHYLACKLCAEPDTRVVLAAPTGKAAMRMEEALRQRFRELGDQVPAELAARLPGTSFTLHRLTGLHPLTGKPRHHAGHPLPVDVVIVDEASMIDVALATRLVEALPENATLILLGDRDQLAAVEKGVVLGALAAGSGLPEPTRRALENLAGAAPPAGIIPAGEPATDSPLAEHIVLLRENFRFTADSGIGRLAGAINRARPDEALEVLESLPAGGDIVWVEESGARLSAARLDALAQGFAGFVAAVRECPASTTGDIPPENLRAVHSAFAAYRVLTALRDGPRGAAGLNDEIEPRLRRALGAPPGSAWFAGRTVIVQANDYTLNLFNGDIGIALPGADGSMRVHFLAADGVRAPLSPARLPAHSSAWAMTVHKAQGSEFDRIALVLPDAESRILSRELLYTGITRARRQACIIGSRERIGEGIARSIARHSGLAARLRECRMAPSA